MKTALKKNKKRLETVTIGVHKDVYEKLERMRHKREKELGGAFPVKLSWTDFIQMVLTRLEGGK